MVYQSDNQAQISSAEFINSNFGQNNNNDYQSTNATLKYALDGSKS